MRRKKGKAIFLILALVTALIFFTAGFFWWRWSLLPVSSQKLPTSKIGYSSAPHRTFVIKKGEGLSSIAARLKEEDLIRDSFAFKILILARGLSGKIQAGDFRIRPSFSTEEIAYLLTYGSLDVWLTFPEGWRREEFARRLAANLENFDTQDFLNLTRDLEGRLFPDTYLIPKEATPVAILKIFEDNFKKKFTSDLKQEVERQVLTQEQVLILASILEREARSDLDRPMVAGILIKRWRENWPLQADATVQYVASNVQCSMFNVQCDWWPKDLTKADLEINSLYNTYKYKGLPPAPICNPGLASIKAVIYPQETDYWFYLSDSQGKMRYAKTIEEHNANIAEFLGK